MEGLQRVTGASGHILGHSSCLDLCDSDHIVSDDTILELVERW